MSQMSSPRDSYQGRSPREDKNKSPPSLEEDIEQFKHSYNDLENFHDKLNDDTRQAPAVRHSADSPRGGAESTMTARTDDNNLLSEKQLRKSNAQLNEVRPLLVEYPRRLEELKRVVHTIKIRHVAETSKLKRRLKDELDRKVQEARDEEREKLRKEMEDLRNEAEKHKVKWMSSTSKLKAESNRLDRAHERLNRAENQTQGNRVELQRSVDLLKKEIQRNHRDLVNCERERRLEKSRADRAEEEVRKLDGRLEILTKGRLHNRTIAAEERAVDLEHKYEVLEWKFKSLVNVVNNLYRQNTPPTFEEVHTLRDLSDIGHEGYSRFPEISESQRPARGGIPRRIRRRRAKTPESTRLPGIPGAETPRKSSDGSANEAESLQGENEDRKPKTPDADTESVKGSSSRPQSRTSDVEGEKVTESQDVADAEETPANGHESSNPEKEPNGEPKENVFLTETQNNSAEKPPNENNASQPDTNVSQENTDKKTVDGDDGSDREEYEKQLEALKRKRRMKKKK